MAILTIAILTPEAMVKDVLNRDTLGRRPWAGALVHFTRGHQAFEAKIQAPGLRKSRVEVVAPWAPKKNHCSSLEKSRWVCLKMGYTHQIHPNAILMRKIANKVVNCGCFQTQMILGNDPPTMLLPSAAVPPAGFLPVVPIQAHPPSSRLCSFSQNVD